MANGKSHSKGFLTSKGFSCELKRQCYIKLSKDSTPSRMWIALGQHAVLRARPRSWPPMPCSRRSWICPGGSAHRFPSSCQWPEGSKRLNINIVVFLACSSAHAIWWVVQRKEIISTNVVSIQGASKMKGMRSHENSSPLLMTAPRSESKCLRCLPVITKNKSYLDSFQTRLCMMDFLQKKMHKFKFQNYSQRSITSWLLVLRL